MAQVVRIKRRLAPGTAGAPAAGDLVAGEMAYNENGNALYIGGAGTPAAIHLLNPPPAGVPVSPTQPAGPSQTGDMWFDSTVGVNRLKVYNGTTWVESLEGAPFLPVANPTFTGLLTGPDATLTGTTGVNLTGAGGHYSIGGANIGRQFYGAAATSTNQGDLWFNTGTSTLSVWNGTAWAATVPAVEGPIIVVGDYNATTHQIVNPRPPASAPPYNLVTGSAVPAASAANRGWLFLTDVAGTGVAPAPLEAFQVGDWLVSNGTAWVRMPMSAILAGPYLPVNNPTATGLLTAPDVTLTGTTGINLTGVGGHYAIGGVNIGRQFYGTAATSTNPGDIWFDTTAGQNIFKVQSGAAWVTPEVDGGVY